MIEARHLTKMYGSHAALRDLSFTVEKGQIYGLLGPNGAGKSTTMNIVTGCLSATDGEVKIGGYDIFEEPDKAKKLIGYLPEQPPLYLNRTPREYLEFVAEAKKIARSERERQIEAVMRQTQIEDVADRLCKNLSKGYKQRVGIAQALLGNPEVIILDEPTVGLDPKQIIEIRELIKSLSKDHTVILSSHILSEVQAVCSMIMIISKGQLIACDTPENLEKLWAGGGSIELVIEASARETEKILKGIEGILSLNIEETAEKRCRAVVDAAADDAENVCRKVFFACSSAEKAILQMSQVKASLEDIFIELTSGEAETAAAAEAEDEPAADNGKAEPREDGEVNE